MDNIHQLIYDSFDIISLILVFVFVLFDVKYPKIKEQLEKDPPPAVREIEYRSYQRDMWSSFWVNAIPLIVIDGLLIYLFLPLLFQVLSAYQFRPWDFDFVQNAFIVVIALIVGFFGWSVYLGALHIKRLIR